VDNIIAVKINPKSLFEHGNLNAIFEKLIMLRNYLNLALLFERLKAIGPFF
jgi:hypothetical protein